MVAAFLAVVAGLFPIVNPVGGAPIFLSLTRGYSAKIRATLAARIAIGGFALMIASLFVGSHILGFFGLTIPAVQVAGGLVVVSYGWRYLQQGDDSAARQQQSKVSDQAILEQAFFPLTMPLTVGPGTISVAITLGAKGAPSHDFLYVAAGAALGALVIAIVIYLCYRFAAGVFGLFGHTGVDVVVRLSSFILLCLGVQIVWNGYSALMEMHEVPTRIPL